MARAGARQLGGWCVAAGCGPALGLACMCMPRGVLVGLCAGCRRAKGVDQRAQDPTRDRSQACFFRVIMRAFISLQENAWRRAHVVAVKPLAQVAAQAQPPQVWRDPLVAPLFSFLFFLFF